MLTPGVAAERRGIRVIRQAEADLLHVVAKMEAGADRRSVGPTSVGEDVVEWVVMHRVQLHSQSDVPADRQIAASADAIKTCPVELVACGRKLMRDTGGKRICRVRYSAFAQGTKRWADEERHVPIVPVDKLW